MSFQCSVGSIFSTACNGAVVLKSFGELDVTQKRRILENVGNGIVKEQLETVCDVHIKLFVTNHGTFCANQEVHPKKFTSLKHLHRITSNEYFSNHTNSDVIKPGAYLCNGSSTKQCFELLIRSKPKKFKLEPLTASPSENASPKADSSQTVSQNLYLRSETFASQPFVATLNKLLVELGGKEIHLDSRSHNKQEANVQEAFNFLIDQLETKIRHTGFKISKIKPKELDLSKEIRKKALGYDGMISQIKSELAQAKTYEHKKKLLAILPPNVSLYTLSKQVNINRKLLSKSRKLQREQGLLVKPNKKIGSKTLPHETVKLVKEFHLRSDISAPSPSIRDSIKPKNGNPRVQKQFMMVHAHKAHDRFIKEFPHNPISFTSFNKFRPPQCITVQENKFHNVCCCKKHEDVKYLFQALRVNDYKNIIYKFVCDKTNKTCMFRTCDTCKENADIVRKDIQGIFDGELFRGKTHMKYQQWDSNPITVLSSKTADISTFNDLVLFKSEALLRHSFVVKSQNNSFKTIKSRLANHRDECLILADFAQNYSTTVQNEVQSGYFSHTQVTLHPFVMYYSAVEGSDPIPISFCVVSDETRHTTNTYYAFLVKIIEYVKQNFPLIKSVHYFTDGCAGQYKNYKSFLNSYFHEKDFGITASLNFFGSGHGKNSCDGIAGKVKSMAKDACLHCGITINNSVDFYNWAVGELGSKKVIFFYVSKEDVATAVDERKLEDRYKMLSTVQYTQRIHKVVTSHDKTSLLFYELSSDTDPLCSRKIHFSPSPAVLESPIITPFHIHHHFICIYEKQWYPAVLLEVKMEIEEAKVHLYKKNPSGHFTKEKQGICSVPFNRIIKEIPSNQGRKLTVEPDIILLMDAYVAALRE